MVVLNVAFIAGTPVVFGGSLDNGTLEILNGAEWELMDLPGGGYANVMVQLPCPIN